MRIFICVLFGLSVAHADCAPASSDLDQAYRSMYNLDFPNALRQSENWQKQYPADPLGPVSEAASYLFSELSRLGSLHSQLFVDDQRFERRHKLVPDAQTKASFESAIQRALGLAEDELKADPRSANAMFSNTLAYGLKADYAALIQKSDVQALAYTKQGRRWAQSAIAAEPACYDAYLALGVENYLLGVKPLLFRAFLRLGGAHVDKEQGIQQLQVTAEKGRFLQPFAKLLLAVAALRDRDYSRAHKLLQELKDEFPGNPLYGQELARLVSKSP